MRNKKGQFVKGYKPVFTVERNKKVSESLKGHVVSEETRAKLRKANMGLRHGPASDERKSKTSKKLMGNRNGVGRKPSEYEKELKRSIHPTDIAWERILIEKKLLEAEGYRVIPITKVIPDMIAMKNGKVYAVEVEYQKPNYAKYENGYKKHFDDVIWILRKVSRSKYK